MVWKGRALLGLGSALLQQQTTIYILTLGVLPAFQRKGIASALVQWVRPSRCCVLVRPYAIK